MWVEVGSLALFALAVYFTLSRLLVSLKEASMAASRIEPVNLSARLSSDHLPSEMSPLIDAFNLALGRLEQGYQVQKAFLEGAAHELKTPLALIRAQIELSSGSDRAALLQDVDLMARQVHQLLHLAEVSEAQNYVYAPTEVASVAREVIDHLYRLAERRSVSLQLLAPDEEIRAKADRSALFVLLKNLTENAIRHSPTGGVVSLHVDANYIEVRDLGDGIDEADFPHLFERFWRGGAERESGAGLGLAICREIARVHGWSLDAHNAKPGAIFRLRFDAAPHDLASES
jgi:two-component system sensor histidine kinase QseC